MDTPGPTFNPRDYPEIRLYNIQAVAAATGVPAITLRSWERRYGIPEPKRDVKGYRLYSQRDIAIARWLRERVQQGIGISRAVNMLRAIESGNFAPVQTSSMDFATLRSHLLEAVASLDEPRVHRVIAEALTVSGIEEVVLELIQPVLYDVGGLWGVGRLSVTCEHVVSHLLRGHLTQLIRITPPPIRDHTIVVGCAPGEFHDIGALSVSLFLRRRGFNVIFAGASIEAETFIADVLRISPAAVCLSATMPDAARSLSALFDQLRDKWRGVLGFGGQAFINSPDLIQRTPGQYFGEDAATATRRIEEALLSGAVV